ncbi:hypothetical protein MUY14_10005 [Amycolatopsis sp. FBCC-B4732]|uniref:WXG100-like domain-containing protein n=1 Tax=Amycolatopsis sp. FBCC-B4732 TaxID=3079339 RepID=UPI001FF50713|nr:hypothetical protein [Amycolatopsis sp. FBCC-B4732]UOX90932.1 hypothetical protein MUY14_10005 [Amycolatopsis sp. FBCC-B4732]
MTDLLEPDGELWRWAVAHGGLAKDSLWPPDSETDAHNLAQAWTDAAKALRDAVQNSDQAAADVRQVWTDAAGFELYYSVHSLNHGGGGGESGIADLATAMDALAALSQDFSNKVSSAKFLIRGYIALNEDLFAQCTSTAARLVFAINVAGQVAKIQKDLADKFGKPPEPKKPKKPHGFWGNVGEFFVGIGEGAKEMVLGFGALAGYADGHWSWSTAGQAWGGLGKFALAAATYAVPGLSSLDQTYGLPGFERGEMGRTLVDAGKSLVAWDDWSDDPARAGGKATFNIVSSVLGTKGAGAAMRGAGAAAAGSRVGAVAAAGRVLETTGSAITKIPTATEVAGKVVRKIPGVEGALSRVGLGRPAPDAGEPAVRREGGTTERPPEDPPGGGPPPENVPSRPQNRTAAEHPPERPAERERAPEEDAPSERPADHTLSERPVEHGPSERAIEGASAGRPVEHGPSERAIEGASAERPIEHGPSERAVERPAEHVSPERPAEGAPSERAAEHPAQPGSVGEAMGREAARHEPTSWRDAKAELDPRTQQAHLTGSLAPEREAHSTAGVDRDHFLEQERWAGASSPEPKTPTQKVAFAFLRGIGVLHTGIDMIAGHDLLPTSKLTPLHPPKDHKPKTHEEKPPEPAPEPKPDDPGLPPKPGENAIAHVDPETLKVDRIAPPAEAKPTPEPTPAGAPHPPADIDSAINPTAGRTPHPDTGHGAHHEPPDPDAGHGPHHDGPPDPDAGHGPHHEPPDPDAGHGPHPDDPPDPDAGHSPHPDDPPTPDEVNARHAESTPSGSSYHAGDPDLGDLPHRVPPDPHGRHTVDVHITPDGRARIGDHHYTPREFAEILRRNADYDGGPIRLIGCGASSNAFAHGLARELDTEVLAPTKAAWTDSHGRVFSSDFEIGPDGRMHPRIPPDGEWNTHHPDGTTHPASDGFAPDTHHDVDADSARHRGDGDDLNPQHQVDGRWEEPENFTPPGEDVRLGSDENFFDRTTELKPDTRYNVLDPDGTVRTRVYTDHSGNVSHVDAHAPNTLHGRNPEVAHPVPDADYRVQVGRRYDIYPTGPDGAVRTVTHNDVKTVHGTRDVTRVDHVETPPEPARHTDVGAHDPRAPRADQPFGRQGNLEPNTRYHVTDTEGNPRGSFQTDGAGQVRWVDTHEGTPGRPNPDLEHRVPNGNYRVDRGPNHQEFRVGTDGRPESAATWRQPPASGEAVVHTGNLRQNDAFNRQNHVDAEGNSTLAGEREHRVTDDHGQFRGSFHTDADGKITHVDTTTGQRARTNPEITHAPEDAKVTQDGFYGTGKAKTVQGTWPQPDREVVFSHQKKGGGFLEGTPDGWSERQVKAVTEPVTQGTPLAGRTDLPPGTRIHLVDQKGYPYSTVQTGPDGAVTHVHTFQPTNADLNYPPPSATVRVDHGLEVRNPDGSTRITEGDVHRTDSRGNTVATSGPPDAAGASQIRRDTTAQSEMGALGGKAPDNRNIDDGGHHGSTSAGKGGESINMSTEGRIDNSNAGAKDVEATYDVDDSWYQMERDRDEHLDRVAHEDVMPARDPGVDDPHTRHYRSYGVDEQGRITVNVRSFPGDHNTPLWPRDFRR